MLLLLLLDRICDRFRRDVMLSLQFQARSTVHASVFAARARVTALLLLAGHAGA